MLSSKIFLVTLIGNTLFLGHPLVQKKMPCSGTEPGKIFPQGRNILGF